MARVNGFDHAMAILEEEVERLRERVAELMIELQNARLANKDLKRRLRECGHATKTGRVQ